MGSSTNFLLSKIAFTAFEPKAPNDEFLLESDGLISSSFTFLKTLPRRIASKKFGRLPLEVS